MEIILTFKFGSFPKGYQKILENLSNKGYKIRYFLAPPSFDNESLPITRVISTGYTIVEHGHHEGLALIRELDSINSIELVS